MVPIKLRTLSNLCLLRLPHASWLLLPLAAAVYFGCGQLLLKYYQYQLNPDGISYISIAQRYARGDFSGAVNAYWGPILAWLLTPWVWLFPDQPLLATKLLSLVIGFGAITGIYSFASRVGMSKFLRAAVVFASIPITLDYALKVVTPDLLLLALILFYLTVLFDPHYFSSLRNSLAAGVLGGALYLTKQYGLVFFLTHFGLFHFWCFFYNRNRRGQIIKSFLVGLFPVILIVLGWSGVLFGKYHSITVGSCGGFNLAVAGPASRGFPVQNLPMFTQGFLPPSAPGALSCWEDPTTLRVEAWNPFASATFLNYLLRNILHNCRRALSLIGSPLGMRAFLLAAATLLIFSRPIPLLAVLLTIIVYPLWYLPVWVEDRYLWPIHILSLVGSFWALEYFRRTVAATRLLYISLAVLLVALFTPASIENLLRGSYDGLPNYLYGKVLERRGITGVSLASDGEWVNTLSVAFHSRNRYFGVNQKGLRITELIDQLKERGIDYYLVWYDTDLSGELNARGKLVGLSEPVPFRVFDVKSF